MFPAATFILSVTTGDWRLNTETKTWCFRIIEQGELSNATSFHMLTYPIMNLPVVRPLLTSGTWDEILIERGFSEDLIMRLDCILDVASRFGTWSMSRFDNAVALEFRTRIFDLAAESTSSSAVRALANTDVYEASPVIVLLCVAILGHEVREGVQAGKFLDLVSVLGYLAHVSENGDTSEVLEASDALEFDVSSERTSDVHKAYWMVSHDDNGVWISSIDRNSEGILEDGGYEAEEELLSYTDFRTRLTSNWSGEIISTNDF
jgi:hypothetical protein